jgi:hypothetical protein
VLIDGLQKALKLFMVKTGITKRKKDTGKVHPITVYEGPERE